MSREEEIRRMIETAPPGGEVISFVGMSLADIKGILTADGTFQLGAPTVVPEGDTK